MTVVHQHNARQQGEFLPISGQDTDECLRSSTTVRKQNILDLDRAALENWVMAMGEKRFHASQLMKWIHQLGETDFQQMNNLSKSFRSQLEQTAVVQNLQVTSDRRATDGTRKWLLRLDDGNLIETVFIPEDGRGTLCVSSQAGCALDCSFCATGRQGFNRNLSAGEIISQVWLAKRLLDEVISVEEKGSVYKITNVVMMGMGEPLLNFDNVVTAVRIMMDDFAYGLSKRRVTVSTAGVVPAMDRLADLLDMRLAVSLHATDDILRNELVPLNRKYPLKELIAACHRFVDKQKSRYRITFEYVLLAGINDRPEHARELIHLLKGLPVLINLIPFNPFDGSGYKTSPPGVIKRFSEIINQADITTVVRKTRGKDIDAACGQLAGKIQDRSRRSRRFEQPRFGMR